MYVGLHFCIFGHVCHVSVYPFSWLVFSQEDKNMANYGFGPFRLLLQRPLRHSDIAKLQEKS